MLILNGNVHPGMVAQMPANILKDEHDDTPVDAVLLFAMNRKELVAAVAERSGNTQAAVSDVLDALFEVFTAQVKKGEKVSIPGWLAVERTERKERTGRNPRTGEEITIPAGHSVKVTAGSKLKAAASE